MRAERGWTGRPTGLRAGVLLLVLAGAASTGSGCGAREGDIVLDGHWRLVHLVTEQVDVTFPSGGPWLVVGWVNRATTGCQVSSFDLEVDGHDVDFVVTSSGSMRSCYPGDEDALEGSYPTHLDGVDHAEETAEGLVLTGDDLVMTYEAVPLD